MNQINSKPSLRFSPTAWAKLLFMRDITDNEVGGFGITEADDLLLVTDFILVKQQVSAVTVSFEDESVADFFDHQVDLGRKPEQFSRIWLHTHPFDSPEPSTVDDETFSRVFGKCDWSVMCVVAQNSCTYTKLRFNTGPGSEMKIPVCVDYSIEFGESDFELWEQQYITNVSEDHIYSMSIDSKKHEDDSDIFGSKSELSCYDLLDKIDELDAEERYLFLGELSVRSDFWNEESEAYYE